MNWVQITGGFAAGACIPPSSFVHVDHHDNAYAAAYEIAKALTEDEGLLATLAKVGVTSEELVAFVKSIGK